MKSGATVTSYVTLEIEGEFLHRLEYHADIHIVRRDPPDLLNLRRRWWLRSDIWSSDWEGIEIMLMAKQEELGISEFKPISTSFAGLKPV